MERGLPWDRAFIFIVLLAPTGFSGFCLDSVHM